MSASDNAIAIACFRFLTTGPFFEPLFNVPVLYSCMTFSTLVFFTFNLCYSLEMYAGYTIDPQ